MTEYEFHHVDGMATGDGSPPPKPDPNPVPLSAGKMVLKLALAIDKADREQWLKRIEKGDENA